MQIGKRKTWEGKTSRGGVVNEVQRSEMGEMRVIYVNGDTHSGTMMKCGTVG
jgi:hypothetical protein